MNNFLIGCAWGFLFITLYFFWIVHSSLLENNQIGWAITLMFIIFPCLCGWFVYLIN